MTKISLKYLLFLFFVVSASLSVKAEETFLFLSFDQFSHLTTTEQKMYIETVQSLVMTFEDLNHFKSSTTSFYKSYYLFSSFFKDASAAAEVPLGAANDAAVMRSDNAEVENERIGTRLTFIKIYSQSAKDHNSEALKSSAKENLLDVYGRLKNLSQRKLTSKEQNDLNTNISNFKEKYENLAAVLPELQSLRSEISRFASEATKYVPPSASSTVAPEAFRKPSCLYAGFVVKSSVCAPIKVLPIELRLQELGKSDFKCKTPNEILCNPLVFGYQADLSPYCVARSKTASKNCQEISNNTDNNSRLQKAWKNPANKKVFDDFQNSLAQLCSSERKSTDVTSTCKVVVAQFNDVVKKEFPAQVAAVDTSKTGKPSKKN